MKLPSFEYGLIGKYRSQLMGIAILNVLLLHSMAWLDFNASNILLKGFSVICGILFTEGFLFLSGFGLYYSYHNNRNPKQFFCKRIQRMLIPYWIMTLPFFIAWMLVGFYGFPGLMLRFSTLEFWINGNYAGMWYISVSVFLYLCFPLIYRCLCERGGVVLLLTLIMIVVSGIFFLNPEYFQKVSLGIVKIPFFVIGAWVGKQSFEKKSLNFGWIVLLIVLLVSLEIHLVFPWLNLQEGMVRLLGLLVCSVFLLWTDKIKVLHVFHQALGWLGQYTLELYIIHLMIMASMPSDFLNKYVQTAIAVGGAFLLCVPAHNLCTYLSDKIVTRTIQKI